MITIIGELMLCSFNRICVKIEEEKVNRNQKNVKINQSNDYLYSLINIVIKKKMFIHSLSLSYIYKKKLFEKRIKKS
jgi:hypothetical protein